MGKYRFNHGLPLGSHSEALRFGRSSGILCCSCTGGESKADQLEAQTRGASYGSRVDFMVIAISINGNILILCYINLYHIYIYSYIIQCL